MEPDSSSDKMKGVSSNPGVQEFGVHLSNGREATPEVAAVIDYPTIPGSVELTETKCDSISSDTLCLTAAPQKPAKNVTNLSEKTTEIIYSETTHCLQNSHEDSVGLSSGSTATKDTGIYQDSKDCANRSCVFQDNSVSKDATNLENNFCSEVKTPFQLTKTKGNSSETEKDKEELYVESIAETVKFKILKKYFGDTRKPGVLHRLHHKRNYGSFKCRECYLSFHYHPSLIFHKYTHRNKHHLYECCKCSYKSSAPGAYMQHELQHHPDHLYQCEVCNIAFLQRSTLTRHNAVNHHHHTDEQWSSSHMCSATLTDKTETAHLMMTHNIPCQEQNKIPKPNSNTQQESELRKEQTKCKFCKQVFPLKGVEYIHHLQPIDKSMSSAKTSCTWCSFIGNSTCHLTQHKRKIHLCCLLCNKKYSHKDLLRQHIQSFHHRLVKSTGMVKARSRPKAMEKKQQPALCMSSETSRQDVEDHQDKHKNLPNNEVVQHWYCMTCKVIFPTKRLLDLHIKLNHRPMKRAIEGRQEQQDDEMGQWRCLLCNTLHETLRECDKHLLRIHPDEYEYCPREEIAEPTLSVDMPVLPESEPPYTCNMCDCKVTSSELLHKHKEEFHKVAYSISITEELNVKQRNYRCRYRCGYTDCLYMNITKHEVYCAQKVPLISKILPSAVLDTSTGKLITKYPEVLKPDTALHQSIGHPVTEQVFDCGAIQQQQTSLTGMLNISKTQEVSLMSDQIVNKMQQASVISNLNVDEMQSASLKHDQNMQMPPQSSSEKEQLSESNMQTFNDRQQLPENNMQNENKTQPTSYGSMQNENKTQQTSHGSMQNEDETWQMSISSMQNEDETQQTSHGSMHNEDKTRQMSHGSMQNEDKTRQTSHGSMQNEDKTQQTSHGSMQNEDKTRQTSNSSMQNENKTQQMSHGSMQNEDKTRQTSNSSMQNENKTRQTSHGSMQNEDKTQQTSNSRMQNENKTLQTSHGGMQNENKTLQTSHGGMQNENKTRQLSESIMQTENKTRQLSESIMQTENKTLQTSNSSMQNVNESPQTSTTCNSMKNENKMPNSSPTACSIHKFNELKKGSLSSGQIIGKTDLLYDKKTNIFIKTTSINKPQVMKTFFGKALQDSSKSFPNSQQQVQVQSITPTDQRRNLTSSMSSNAAILTAHKNPTIIVLPTSSGKMTKNSSNTIYSKKEKVIVYRRRDEISSSSDDDSECSWLDKSSCSDEDEDENGNLSPVFLSSDEEVQEVPNQGTIQSSNKNKLVNPGTSPTRTITSCPPLLQPTVLMRFFQAIDMSDLYRLALQMITGSPQPHTLPTSDPLMDAVKTTSFKYKIPMGYSHKEFHDMPLFPSSCEVMRIDYMQTLPSKLVSKHYKNVVAKPQVSLLTSLIDGAVLDHVKGNVLKGVERFVRKQRVEDRKDITLSLSQYIVSQYFKNQEKKGSSQNPLGVSLGTGSGNSPGAGPSCVKTKPLLNKTAAFKSPANRPSPSSTQVVEVNRPAVYQVAKAVSNGQHKQSNIQHSSKQEDIKKSSNLKRKTNISCHNREKEATITNKSKNVKGRSPEVGKSEKKDEKSMEKTTACRETDSGKAVASLKVKTSPKHPISARNESVPLRRSSRLLRTSGQQCDNNSEAITVSNCDGEKPVGKRTSSHEQKDHKVRLQEKKRKMYKQTCINENDIDSGSKNDTESCQKDNQDDSKPQTVLKAKTRCNESKQPGCDSSNSDQNPPKSFPLSSQTTSLTKLVTTAGNLNKPEPSNLNHALHEYSSYGAHHDEHNAVLHVAPETILPEIYLDTKMQHTSTETNTVERNGILQMTRHPLHGLNRGTVQIHIGANAGLYPPNCKAYLKHTGTVNVENVKSPARPKLMESITTQNGLKTRGVGPVVDPSLQPDDTEMKKPLTCKWNEGIEKSFKPLLYKKTQTCISNPENQPGLRNWAGHTWKQTVSKAEVLELMTKRKTWKCAPYKIETVNIQEGRTAMEMKTELVSNRISVCPDKTVSGDKVKNHSKLINMLDAGNSTVSHMSSSEDCAFRNDTQSNISKDGKECGNCTKDEMSHKSIKGGRMECKVGPSKAEIQTATGEHDELHNKPLQGSHNMIIADSTNRCKGTAEQKDNGVDKHIIRRRSGRSLKLKRKAVTDPKDDKKKQNSTVDHSYIKSPRLVCKIKSTCNKSKSGYQLRNRCGIMAGVGHIGVGMQTNTKRLKAPHDHCYISTKKPKTTANGADKTDHCYYWKTLNAQKAIQKDNHVHKHEDTSLTQCDKGQTKPKTQHQDRICENTHSQARDHSYSIKYEHEQKAAMDHCYVKITPIEYMDNRRWQDVIQNPSRVNAEPDVQEPEHAGCSQVMGRSTGEVVAPNICDEMPDRRVLRPRRKGDQH